MEEYFNLSMEIRIFLLHALKAYTALFTVQIALIWPTTLFSIRIIYCSDEQFFFFSLVNLCCSSGDVVLYLCSHKHLSFNTSFSILGVLLYYKIQLEHYHHLKWIMWFSLLASMVPCYNSAPKSSYILDIKIGMIR